MTLSYRDETYPHTGDNMNPSMNPYLMNRQRAHRPAQEEGISQEQLNASSFEGLVDVENIDANRIASASVMPSRPTSELDAELMRIAMQQINGGPAAAAAPVHPGQPTQIHSPFIPMPARPAAPSYKLLKIGGDDFRVNLTDGVLEKKVTVPMTEEELSDLYVIAPKATAQKCATSMDKYTFMKRVWQKIDQ